MKNIRTASVFYSIALIGAGALTAPGAWAMDNTLMFHGQLVNAACEARVTGPGDASSMLKPLKVNAELTLRLVSHDDACSEAALPVSIAYVERTSISAGAHSAIVTLTYQ
jgi:type 1 fimbria pilin